MRFEKNRNSKKYFLCGLILVVVLTVAVTFITSKANYRMTASIPLTEGKVVSSPYDINVMAIYINEGDGNYQELSKETTIPTGYTINKENTYCCKGSNCKRENKDNNAILETIGGIHTFRGISKGDKCFIYLDKDTSTAKTMSELLETHYTGRKIRLEGTFNKTIENTTIGVIYEGEDDDGTTYYFAGNPLDNWVEFGEYYWRIIRINGDGSIRLIYQGRTEDESGNKLEPQTAGSELHIGFGKYNNIDTDYDNAYVGFMYGTINSDTYEVTHENKNDSTVKSILDNWITQSYIKYGSIYFNKIDLEAGFCNDRSLTSGLGVAKSGTIYKARTRTENVTPSFKCINKTEDLFTYKSAKNGNKKLENPIGLITIDEAHYAGVGQTESVSNYLYTGSSYWTMSPYGAFLRTPVVNVSSIRYTGQLWNNDIISNIGVRPVINLRSDVTFTGDGTINNPFKVIV
ncbi:MAG: hypothetical protein NC483_06020 [Ruminococcus sp.]|nr:hypothetical protein [Ruminococcus sp.]